MSWINLIFGNGWSTTSKEQIVSPLQSQMGLKKLNENCPSQDWCQEMCWEPSQAELRTIDHKICNCKVQVTLLCQKFSRENPKNISNQVVILK